MKTLTPDEIRDIFNKSAAEAKENVGAVLPEISRAIRELQDAGLDITVEIFPYPCKQSFGMADEQSNTMPMAGIIRTGTCEHLFAIRTKNDGKPCLDLFMSRQHIRFNPLETVWAHKFDLTDKENSLCEFQQELILRCARLKTFHDADTSHAFGDKYHIYKTGLDLKR